MNQIQQKLISYKIDIEFDETKYDSCNPLVLDKKDIKTKTNKSKIFNKNIVKTKVLSKKQRKKLEKVLERKNRKLNVIIICLIKFCFYWFLLIKKRTKLLNDLQEFKAEDREMALMSSTSDVQTYGRKRFLKYKIEIFIEN